MLGSIDDQEGVRVVRSVSNALELSLLRFLPSRVKIDGVVARSDLLQKTLVGDLKQRYRTVFSWSIPDATTGERLAAWGVNGLIVDDPEVLEQLRRLFQRAEE
jgi:glycerophosphoryl diester phosphodiesterase